MNLVRTRSNALTDLKREQAKKKNACWHELKAKGYSPYIWTGCYMNTNTDCDGLSPSSRQKIVAHVQLMKYESITPTATYQNR